MSCEYCNTEINKFEDIKPCSGTILSNFNPKGVYLHNTKDDTPGLVLFDKFGMPLGYFDIKYCPMCGEELNGTSNM